MSTDDAVPPNVLHEYVPAERTGVLAASTAETDDGPLLAECYAYPDPIPERTSPALEAHSVVIALEGTGALERRLDGGSWTRIDDFSDHVSLRPAGRALTLRGRSQNLRVLAVRFPPALLRRIAAENETDPTGVRLRDTAATQDAVLTRLGQALRHHVTGDATPAPVVLSALVESVAARLFVGHCRTPHAEPSGGPLPRAVADRVRDYVQAHLADDLTVADLAECAGMGVSRFTRRFNDTVGCSPYRYVLRRRVETAAERLRRTDRPIAEIAMDVGFSSQSHLTRRFKQIRGTTPGAYRRAYE